MNRSVCEHLIDNQLCGQPSIGNFVRNWQERREWPDKSMPIDLCAEHGKGRKPVAGSLIINWFGDVPKLVIDYEPTKKKQHNPKYLYCGEWLTLTEISNKTGVKRNTILKKIERGHDIETAVNRDTRKTNKGSFRKIIQYTMDGTLVRRFQSIKRAAQVMKITTAALQHHLRGASKKCKGFIFKYDTTHLSK